MELRGREKPLWEEASSLSSISGGSRQEDRNRKGGSALSSISGDLPAKGPVGIWLKRQQLNWGQVWLQIASSCALEKRPGPRGAKSGISGAKDKTSRDQGRPPTGRMYACSVQLRQNCHLPR